MAAHLFEDQADLPIGLVRAEIPSDPARPDHVAAYPNAILSVTTDEETRTFRTLLLENDYLRVEILPDLGGRIYRIFDRRTGQDLLGWNDLRPVVGGPRGAYLPAGVTLRTTGSPRANDLGFVVSQIEPTEDENEPVAVWLSEIGSGDGLSWHMRIGLPPDRAEIWLEVRVFNREPTAKPYNGGLAIALPGGKAFAGPDGGFTWVGPSGGLHVVDEDGRLGGGSYDGATLAVHRFDGERGLMPRQLDSWNLRLVPFTGFGPTLATADVAIGRGEDALRVQVSRPFVGAKVLLETPDGQTLEAAADLYPESLAKFPLGGLLPKSVMVLSENRDVLYRDALDQTRGALPETLTGVPVDFAPGLDLDDPAGWADADFDVTHRAQAAGLRASAAMGRGDFAGANLLFERALLFNAEDHLTWWGKAVARRHLGELAEAEEVAELLNAHFLAPLDPMLRAEAFLSQAISGQREANPLVAPLADFPDQLVEVAVRLSEIGRFDDASRWIDEAVRHRDLMTLRLLWAFTYLEGSRMEAEAAQQVALAERLPFESPLPWRHVEFRAVNELAARFPNSLLLMRLKHWSAVLSPTK